MTSRPCIVISAGMIALFFLQLATQSYSTPLNTVPSIDSALYHMELPGRGWAIEVGLPGFVIQQEEVQAQAQGARMMGEKPNSGTYVSIFMEPRLTSVSSKFVVMIIGQEEKIHHPKKLISNCQILVRCR